LVIGGGNAALCAAITAREAGASVLMLESAPREWRGGNSVHTRNIRCMHDAPQDVLTESYPEEEFWQDLYKVTGGVTNEVLARRVIRKSATCRSWMRTHGVHFQPSLSGTLHLSRTNAFFMGGGKALVNAYYRSAQALGIEVRYEAAVERVELEDGRFIAAYVASTGPTAGEAVLNAAADATPSTLKLEQMVAGQYQPRKRMDEGALYELAESIKSQGVMQPILVRKTANGGYEIIAGERRFRAAKLAGLTEVPVLVRDVSDQNAAAMALIENMQREDLNPLEEAIGLQRLIKEFGLTHEQAAQAVGRSRSAATNLLRLLNLAEPVQTMLVAGDLEMGHARALLSLDRAAQITAANQISAKKMSVREAESLVKKIGADFSLVTQKPVKDKSRDIKRLEEELSDWLTAQVEIRIKKQTKRHGKVDQSGELAIAFGSIESLNGLIDKLQSK
jgi:ParB family chromosome partitioning protein